MYKLWTNYRKTLKATIFELNYCSRNVTFHCYKRASFNLSNTKWIKVLFR